MDERESLVFQLHISNLKDTLFLLRTERLIDQQTYLDLLREIWNCKENQMKKRITERMRKICQSSRLPDLAERCHATRDNNCNTKDPQTGIFQEDRALSD